MKTHKQNAILFVMLLAFLLPLPLAAQDRGLSVVARDNLGAAATVGRQYALLIAIDGYRSWNPLKKPVADAREIKDILGENYYIDEFIELYNANATKQNIIRTFTNLQNKLGVNDSLFIYYAGHGHLDEASNAGFWIPQDAGTDIYSQENWLPNSQIRGYISRLKTIHVLMVSDACFSGDILNTNRALAPQIDNAYFRKAYALVSRQVITSGSSETVPDQSEFSAAIKMCLRKNTAPLLDPHQIYNDVRLSVRRTTPLLGSLNQADHQEGATFLFFRKSASNTPAPATTPQAVQPAATAAISGAASTGSLNITSQISGTIMIDGIDTGIRVKAGGNALVQNIATGTTEIAIKADDGTITKASAGVLPGQTVNAEIRSFAAVAAAVPAPAGKPEKIRPRRPGNFEIIQGGKSGIRTPIDMTKFHRAALDMMRKMDHQVLEETPGVIVYRYSKGSMWMQVKLCYWTDEYWYEYVNSGDMDADPANDRIHRLYRRWIENADKTLGEFYR
ncbi:MAG: caspase family protein [Spirochaetales bacterium]|jgi:hypothetical protein|nr:caspase family protein [Spirochaetales bacterium]